MLIVMAAVLLVILVLCGFGIRSKNNDFEGLSIFVGFVSILVFGICLLTASVQYIQAEGRIAELNEMRRMISEVGPDDANMEDVYGEAAKLNRKLSKAKRYNQMFVLDPWYPDEYVNQNPIALPAGSQN